MIYCFLIFVLVGSFDRHLERSVSAATNAPHTDVLTERPKRTAPVDGGWGIWSDGYCSVSCGLGKKYNYQSCDNPSPRFGGRFCTGLSEEIKSCNLRDCPGEGLSTTEILGAIFGAVIFFTFVVVICKRCWFGPKLPALPPVTYTAEEETDDGIEDDNVSHILSGQESPESEHIIPSDSKLTEISDGPPRYHSMFPTGYVPVLSHNGLLPTYEEASEIS